jgi:SAM-dependent methyltransferase
LCSLRFYLSPQPFSASHFLADCRLHSNSGGCNARYKNSMTSALRVCPRCAAVDLIKNTEDVWPTGWTCWQCGHVVPSHDGIPMFAPELADTESGFDPADFAVLASVEREHFWFEPRNRLITSLIIRYFPTATRLLEVGCGTGMVLSAIAELRPWRRLVGSELHPAGLVEARRRLGDRARFVQMDARVIPSRNAFDVAGAFDVIEHVVEDEKVLIAMRDAIVPGGGIILAVPQHPSLWSDVDERAHHVRRYCRGELEEKLESVGMKVVFSGSYTVLLFPLMAMNRILRGRKRRSEKAAESREVGRLRMEFRLPRILNMLARAQLQAEVSMTLAGMRFPFGGSRVVVATKR